MGCKRCAENRARTLEKRRQMEERRLEKLRKDCDAGDEMSCINLHHILSLKHHRENNKFRSEFHRKA